MKVYDLTYIEGSYGQDDLPWRKRLKDEVQSIFADAGEELALIDGCEVGGVSLSMVTGSVPKWDKVGFLKKHNLSAADYEAFVKTTPKDPYLLIVKKGGK
mgnify:CR=1 FL=1